MPSQALQDFRERLKEVQELLDAHSALTGLRNAQAALNAGPASALRRPKTPRPRFANLSKMRSSNPVGTCGSID